jgi:UDPglucose--hexose-1-phosphate uridylyltransferase
MERELLHRRLSALTGEWVLVSPHRTQRPRQGRTGPTPPESLPPCDPRRDRCTGNTRAGGHRTPESTGPFEFTNGMTTAEIRAVAGDSPVLASSGERQQSAG